MIVIAYLVQCLAKASAIVGGIHLNESKQGMARLPDPKCQLFDPVPCDSQIGIYV